MQSLYYMLKADIESFITAASLLTYGRCCDPYGPELKKLAAITSFKSSLTLSRLRYGQTHCDCYIYKDLIHVLNAEGLALYGIDIKEDGRSCTLCIEYRIYKANLNIGVYDWSEAETDLIIDRISKDGVFDPALLNYNLGRPL